MRKRKEKKFRSDKCEGDENDNVKTNMKWLWIGKAKQENRKWEIKENEIRKDFGNWLLK